MAEKNEWLKELEKQAQEKRQQKEREKRHSMQLELPSVFTDSNISLNESVKIKNEFGGRRRPIDSIKKFEEESRQENINAIANQLGHQSTLALDMKEIKHMVSAVNSSDTQAKRSDRIPFSGAVRLHSPTYHRIRSTFSEDDTQLQMTKEMETERWKAFLKKQILEKELQKAKQHHLDHSNVPLSNPHVQTLQLNSQNSQTCQNPSKPHGKPIYNPVESASKLPILVKKQISHMEPPEEALKLNQMLHDLVEKKKRMKVLKSAKSSKSVKSLPEKSKEKRLDPIPRKGITSWPKGNKAHLIQNQVEIVHQEVHQRPHVDKKQTSSLSNNESKTKTQELSLKKALPHIKPQIHSKDATLPLKNHASIHKLKPIQYHQVQVESQEEEEELESQVKQEQESQNPIHAPLEQQLSNESLERQALMSQIQTLWNEFIKNQNKNS